MGYPLFFSAQQKIFKLRVFGKADHAVTPNSFEVLKCNAINTLQNAQDQLFNAREYCCSKS